MLMEKLLVEKFLAILERKRLSFKGLIHTLEGGFILPESRMFLVLLAILLFPVLELMPQMREGYFINRGVLRASPLMDQLGAGRGPS